MTSAQQLELIFGVPFQQQPDITALRQFHANNTFCENGKGEIIGICACKNDFEKIQLPASILQHLEYLNLSDNQQLKQLAIDGALPVLKHLDISDSQLEQLTLPDGMECLEWLDISRNELQQLHLKGRLPVLIFLDLSGNKLSRLVLDAQTLQYAYFLDNELEEITFLTIPGQLEILHLKNNKLQSLPDNLLAFQSLKALYLHGNPLPALPSELIAEEEGGNSLEAVKRYLQEFQKGTIINDRAKLIIVGNGRVGKTSIFRRLSGENFNPVEPYTHGVNLGQLEKKDLPQVEKTDSLQLQVWDFGGQEIFYATHQFFLSEEAVYLLAWTDKQNVIPHRERDKTKLPYDKKWRSNEYWLENIRLHGKESPIVMVQTHSDVIANRKPEELAWSADPYRAVSLRFSAAKDFGLDDLRAILGDRLNAAVPMLGQEFPRTYNEAIKAIEALKQTNPSIPYSRFLELCRQVKIDEGGEAALLDYLVKAGIVVYFNKPLLSEVIYINPNWLTDQVYALINENLRPLKGKINASYLKEILPEPDYDDQKREQFLELLKSFELIFQPEGETYYIAPQYLPEELEPNEQILYDTILEDLDLGFVFWFPRFLPDNAMINFLSRYGPYSKQLYWKNGIFFKDNQKTKCIVRFHEADRRLSVYTPQDEAGRELQREICQAFVELSKNANAAISLDGKVFASWQELERYQPLYSQSNQLQFFALDATTPLYLQDFMRFFGKEKYAELPLAEVSDMETIRGLVRKNRLKDALDLLIQKAPSQEMDSVTLIQRQLNDLEKQKIRGTLSFDQESIARNRIADRIIALIGSLSEVAESLNPEVKVRYQGKPDSNPESSKPAPKIYFSYAWGDAGESGESREKIVDQLYDSLTQEGFKVLRDKMNIEYGGLISRFMKELGTGDLIVVFISDKYARSPYCMFELYEIARNNKLDKELFRTRILPVPVERIRFDEPDVLEVYFQHWETEVQKWENLLTKRMHQISEAQSARYHKIKIISQNLGQLSDWLADINSSSTELLRENNFALVKDAIQQRFEELKARK